MDIFVCFHRNLEGFSKNPKSNIEIFILVNQPTKTKYPQQTQTLCTGDFFHFTFVGKKHFFQKAFVRGLYITLSQVSPLTHAVLFLNSNF